MPVPPASVRLLRRFWIKSLAFASWFARLTRLLNLPNGMTREQLRNYLEFYRDLGMDTIYKPDMAKRVKLSTEPAPAAEPKTETAPIPAVIPAVFPSEKVTSLFATTELPGLAPQNDTLDAIRLDIGDCRRCRLC